MRKNIGQKLLAAFMLFVVMAFVATDASAYSVKQVFARVSAVAAETLTTGQVVMLKTDGLAYKADANDAALRPAIGIIGKGGATSATVEIITIGVLSGWTTLTEGAPGYLSETAAGVTQSAPAYSQQVGQAITATSYMFNFQNYFDSSSLTVLGTLDGASPLVLEGATANDFETTIAVTDPTADRTITLPDADGVPILSAVVPTAATSVYGAANAIIFEGATDDAHETTLDVADPTADVTYRLPVAAAGTYSLVSSSLATNAPDIANSVTGGTNQLILEGATADAFETVVTPTDPTADRTVTLADASGTVMLSSLATNGADAANAVTGTSNGLLFEGVTADAFETTLTVTDPTVDRTVTIPDAAGTVNLNCTASHDYGGAAVAWTLTVAEMQCGAISVTNANAGVDALLPSAIPGKTYTVLNGSGQILTFKVTGQTGGTIASTKWALYTTIAADVAEVYELP